MSRSEILKSSYGDDKLQRECGMKKLMIVAYLCVCKFKKHYNPRYIQEYQISEICFCCYGIARLVRSVLVMKSFLHVI